MRESESSPRGVRGRVLIADDTLGVARFAARVLGQAGYECEACANGVETLSAVEQRGADVVLADLTRQGPELLAQVHGRYPGVALIVLTFNPGVGSAIAAMRQGAFDYLVKPLDEDELCALVNRAIEINRLRNENAQLRGRLEMAEAASSFVAESPSGKHLLALVRRVASTDSIVLIEGESGTGKELLARMLHYWSERSEGPFVAVDCKGSQVAMVEPIRNGSSGSAAAAQSIPLKRALGGTLFLDEIAKGRPRASGGNGTDPRPGRGGEQPVWFGARRANRRGQQPRTQGRGRSGAVSHRPALPAGRDADPDSSVARAARGHPGAFAPVRRRLLREDRAAVVADLGCRTRTARLSMARQRSRASQRDRAGRDADRGGFRRLEIARISGRAPSPTGPSASRPSRSRPSELQSRRPAPTQPPIMCSAPRAPVMRRCRRRPSPPASRRRRRCPLRR